MSLQYWYAPAKLCGVIMQKFTTQILIV